MKKISADAAHRKYKELCRTAVELECGFNDTSADCTDVGSGWLKWFDTMYELRAKTYQNPSQPTVDGSSGR